jgi:hypothetical protein
MAAAAALVLTVLWLQLNVPRERPAISDAELDRLAANTRLVLQKACRAVERVERIAWHETMGARIGPALRHIPLPRPQAPPEPVKESNGEQES